MRLLELFAGTGSVGRAFRDLGWEVIGLDITRGHAIQTDILKWDYAAAFPEGYFDAIHASPPCTHYSIARTSGKTPRDLVGADALVQRTLDVIAHFKPKIFIIENPHTGLMKSRPVMQHLTPYLRPVTYCKYGTLYKKPTAIWTNLGEHWLARAPCAKANPCNQMVNGSHQSTAQTRSGWTTRQLYVLPAPLCDELAAATHTAVAALNA